jgi:excisionase family DNA binding protein
VKDKKQAASKPALHESESTNSQQALRTSTISSKEQRPDNFAEASARGSYNVLIALRAIRRLMTVDEVAELLTNSACTVYRMVRRNEMPSSKSGSMVCSGLHCRY